MAYNNDNLAVAIHDTDNIITEENIEECVVDYWTQRVKDFSDVREHELNSDMGKEWLEEIISNISIQIYRYRIAYLRLLKNINVPSQQHIDLIAALESRDSAKAKKISKEHIVEQANEILKSLHY